MVRTMMSRREFNPLSGVLVSIMFVKRLVNMLRKRVFLFRYSTRTAARKTPPTMNAAPLQLPITSPNRMMKAKRAEMELNKAAEKKVFVPRKKK